MALLDPTFQALCMEVMPWVTFKLCNYILSFIRYHANNTVTIMHEFVWIILCLTQRCNNSWHLCLNHSSVIWSVSLTSSSSSLWLTSVSQEHVNTWNSTQHHDVYKYHNVTNEKNDEHHGREERCFSVFVAII